MRDGLADERVGARHVRHILGWAEDKSTNRTDGRQPIVRTPLTGEELQVKFSGEFC